ncbi:DNA replication and repair protein RecF, partial [Faecalibacterium prausnitzii]|nr:DNA replication and repair protein RecF [Faecalibacterium prausnitzii]
SANGQERPYAEKRTLLEVLNTELAAQGEALQQRRREYLKLLAPRACANYAELSHGAERMSICYAAQFAPGGLADLLR